MASSRKLLPECPWIFPQCPCVCEVLLLLQKSFSVVHILYDSICDVLVKLLRRFLKPHKLLKKSTDWSCIRWLHQFKNCHWRKHKKGIKWSNTWSTKITQCGIQSVFGATGSQLWEKLPVGIELLRQLGCLNHVKREMKSMVLSEYHQYIAAWSQCYRGSRWMGGFSSGHWFASLQSKRKERSILEWSILIVVMKW